jgi:hypothetical protein
MTLQMLFAISLIFLNYTIFFFNCLSEQQGIKGFFVATPDGANNAGVKGDMEVAGMGACHTVFKESKSIAFIFYFILFLSF